MERGAVAQHMTRRHMQWTFRGALLRVEIEESKTEGVVEVNSTRTTYRLLHRSPHSSISESDGQTHRLLSRPDQDGCTVWWNGRTFRLQRASASGNAASTNAPVANGDVRAVMPGKILRIDVQAGSVVEERQPL